MRRAEGNGANAAPEAIDRARRAAKTSTALAAPTASRRRATAPPIAGRRRTAGPARAPHAVRAPFARALAPALVHERRFDAGRPIRRFASRFMFVERLAEIRTAHERIVEHRARGPEREPLAEIEHERRLAHGIDQVDVVIDQQHLRADAFGNANDHVGEPRGFGLVQARARLVEQQQARRADERLAEFQHAALIQVERRALRVRDVGEADEFERAPRVVARGEGRHHVLGEREHVVVHAQILDDLFGLERAPHARAHALGDGQREQRAAVQRDAARTRPQEAAQYVQQRRLARAVRADQPAYGRSELRVERVEHARAAELHGQVRDFDHRAPPSRARNARPTRDASPASCPAMPAGAVTSACSSAAPKKIIAR
ncbi:conserved hypothetical protein [Burkholderia pseudomallei 1710b]|uniref:Uncharacterized protein n=1 Tax=Burkholderia pseudomallei (strain 1710b) TaxID=320372 RepID=Q3JXM2_BURP1|nr:conserved hypothetical protein [Burkholderia pseudomallei 1710b]